MSNILGVPVVKTSAVLNGGNLDLSAVPVGWGLLHLLVAADALGLGDSRDDYLAGSAGQNVKLVNIGNARQGRPAGVVSTVWAISLSVFLLLCGFQRLAISFRI